MVSNRGLSVLIIVAVVFSLSAQFISVFWLDQASIHEKPLATTTYATSGSGVVRLNITRSTDISITNATVDFGVGIVNASRCTHANLSNNGSGWNSDNCWVNDTAGPGKPESSAVPVTSSKIVIQNDGSVNSSITMTSTQGSAANFVGNCTGGLTAGTYTFAVNSNESGDVTAANTCPGSHRTAGWTAITGASQDVCTMLNFEDARDAINVIFNLSICRTTDQAGSINDTLTFTSAAA